MLLNSLHTASQSFNASSIGTMVAGQNLANANTPNYVRETVLQSSNSTINYGNVALGSGVSVQGVVQMIDTYLEERLRNSLSDAMNASTQAKYSSDLEVVLSELSDNDISTSLNNFFNSIGDILNHPESVSYRQLSVSKAEKLVTDFNTIGDKLIDMRTDINKNIETLASEVNRLCAEIADLNKSIAEIEAGQSPATQAVGLRDSRLQALSDLSQLINIKTSEDTNTGMVTVSCGSNNLVMDAISRGVYVEYESDPYGQISLATVKVEGTNHPLGATSGQLYGYYQARDEVIGNYAVQLDEYAYQFIRVFNEQYASGQGMTGYSQLSSIATINETDIPLDKLGLDYNPKNGTFDILVHDKNTGQHLTHTINVQLGELAGKDGGTTLEDLVAQINAIEGVSAKIDGFGHLEISSESPELEFAFSNDTSGVLSSLGLNTFFTGSDARTIGINSIVQNDPGKFAASGEGIGHDTSNAVTLAHMPEVKSDSLQGQSITQYYKTMNDGVNTSGARLEAVAQGTASYYSSLSAQRASISGVNIDEESLNLMTYQRTYQATAKYVTVINEMLDALIAM